MKKFLTVLLSLSLCLSLAACGGKAGGKKDFDPAADAKALLNAGAFTETLVEIDKDVACALYGIDPDRVESCAVYGSAGATAEELALFSLKSHEDAEAAAKQLGYRVEDRKDELAAYLPDELSKLDSAVIEARDRSVLLVIAADYAPVETFLKGK